MPTLLVCLLVVSALLQGPGAPAGRSKPERPPTLAELRDELSAPRPEARKSAVRRLAELGTQEAYASLLSALEDPEGIVADEAQIRASGARDARQFAELLGPAGLRSREAGVPARAAEALGRATIPLEARVFEKALRGADAETARMLCWSVERLAAARRLTGDLAALAADLVEYADGRSAPEARGAALLALRFLDTRAAESRTLACAAAREPALRCAALLAARDWTEIAATRFGTGLAADPEASVRAGAVELLARTTGRDAALALVDRLEREDRSRLRWRILVHLRSLSGADHGFDAEKWREWARQRAGTVATGEPRGGGPVGDTRVALAGLPLVSDRVAFLIDLSGSMWGAKVAGRTRKEIVDAQLGKALLALPKTAHFNVIPYTSEAFPWEKRLVPAEPARIRNAIEDFERCRRSGRGNVWAGIEAALLDPDLDAVVVLTDGVPTGGPHGDFDLMVALLLERNRFRNVAFDSILVDAPRGRIPGWAALAAESGGRSTTVELAALAADDGHTSPGGG
ncbi:MAG: hypothetical protein NTY35_14535 [Planctomycetota bacterium]|nr:hypothetical protein [Planctomycetota bacterium]